MRPYSVYLQQLDAVPMTRYFHIFNSCLYFVQACCAAALLPHWYRLVTSSRDLRLQDYDGIYASFVKNKKITHRLMK